MSKLAKTVLSPGDEAEICRRRFEKNAVAVLAKHYGVGQERVRRIWKAHYGGTTIADAKLFLEKGGALAPVAKSTPQADASTVRRAGKFIAEVPQTQAGAAPAMRARPARVVKPAAGKAPRAAQHPVYHLPPPEPELPERLDADVGMMSAGNDSRDLAAAVLGQIMELTAQGKTRAARQAAQEAEEAIEDRRAAEEAPDEPSAAYEESGDALQYEESGDAYDDAGSDYVRGELRAPPNVRRPHVQPAARRQVRRGEGERQERSLEFSGSEAGPGMDEGSFSLRADGYDGSFGDRWPGEALYGGFEEEGGGGARGQARPRRARVQGQASAGGARRGGAARDPAAGAFARGEGDAAEGGAGRERALVRGEPVRTDYWPIPASGRRLRLGPGEEVRPGLRGRSGPAAEGREPGARGNREPSRGSGPERFSLGDVGDDAPGGPAEPARGALGPGPSPGGPAPAGPDSVSQGERKGHVPSEPFGWLKRPKR